MTISSRAHYAIKAMLNLAFQVPNPVSLTALAKKLDISLSYLEQIFALLRRHHLVKGVRGPGGGYVLGKPTEVITVADVVTAIDVNRKTSASHGHPQSATLLAWGMLESKIFNHLDGITLASLHEETAERMNVADTSIHAAA
ncbi:MAG: Rrf2 family transcriptional regulator [Gammaproteobacteria bacterium]|nr:Rrf2 family transcriptional regulator [Gammaproteobacteria bacterium]